MVGVGGGGGRGEGANCSLLQQCMVDIRHGGGGRWMGGDITFSNPRFWLQITMGCDRRSMRGNWASHETESPIKACLLFSAPGLYLCSAFPQPGEVMCTAYGACYRCLLENGWRGIGSRKSRHLLFPDGHDDPDSPFLSIIF